MQKNKKIFFKKVLTNSLLFSILNTSNEREVNKMREVIVKLNNVVLGKEVMTVEEIRKAEAAGFTVLDKLNK